MTQHKTTQDTVVQDFDILKACMKTSSDVVRSYHSPKIKTLYELIIRYKDNLGKNHYCRSNELYTIEQITYIIENKKNFKIDIVGNSKKKLCALIGEVKSSTVNMKALGDIEIINSQSTAEKYLPACEFAILSIIDALMIYAVFFKFQYTNLATRLVLYFFAIAFFIVSFVILIQLTKMIKLPRMKDAKKTVTKDFYVYFIDRPTFGGKIYYVKFLFVDDNGQIRIAKQVVSMFRYDMIKKIKELPIAVHGTKAAIDFDKINF